MLNFLKTHKEKFIILFFLVLFLSQCSTKREVQALRKENTALHTALSEELKEEISTSESELKRYISLKTLEYLILEDDIDRGRKNISEAQLELNNLLLEEKNGKK